MKFKIENLKLKIQQALIKLRRLKGTRIMLGIIVIIALSSVVFVQYKIKERIFKKPPPKKVGALPQEVAPPQEPILVKVYKVQKREFEDTLPALGTVKGFKEIDLKFETSGVVDSFNFKEGERVEEGEIIVTINQKDALLKLKYNEIELEKHQKLYDIGAIVKSKLDQVKLELESAKRELDKTYLYATRSGVLGTKDVEIGEYITPNDKVATLIDDKEVFVEIGVVERDIGKIKVGQSAKITVDTYPDTEFTGTVDNVSPIIEGKSRTQSAKIKIKNPKGQLLPGMFARASCAVYKTTDAVVILNTALDKTEEGYVVYVVKKTEEAKEETKEEQGIAEARPINIDYRASEFFVVKEGLEEGEFVVVETQEKLKDGYKVIITETEEAAF